MKYFFTQAPFAKSCILNFILSVSLILPFGLKANISKADYSLYLDHQIHDVNQHKGATVKSLISLQFEGTEDLTISLLDQEGKQVAFRKISGSPEVLEDDYRTEIPVHRFSPGLYTLYIQTEQERREYQIQIQ